MGEPVEDPGPGIVCENFNPPEDAPPFIYVYFWGIDPCPAVDPPPNGQLFKCTQVEGLPCKWVHDTVASDWVVEVQMLAGPISTHIQLFHQNGEDYFNRLRAGWTAEHDVFEGEVRACSESESGSGGFATVFWLDILLEIVLGFTFPDDGTLLFEFFMKDDSDPVYKLCDRLYGTNIKFLLSS